MDTHRQAGRGSSQSRRGTRQTDAVDRYPVIFVEVRIAKPSIADKNRRTLLRSGV
jgi:hypothetical protein